MFKRIMLPLDGSEVAEITLPYSEELARELGSELILFHVRGPEHEYYERMHQMYLDRLAETSELNIRKDQPMGKDVRVTTLVESGEPHENICNFVEKNGIDLIIMASVSAAGIKVAKTLGSVADHVCRTVPIPVMLIRPQDIQRIESKKRLINRILLPLDGSKLSKLALPVVEELAVKMKTPITLFQMAHIIIPYNADGMTMDVITPTYYTQLSESEERRVQAEMVALEKELRGKSLIVDHSVTSGFNAANEIIEVSKKISADLIVMSTHGRSGLGRWFLGSTTEKVLRHGEVPLLLVRAGAS
jgi:nucleotide-binding universal stress UspA family protein